MLAPSTTSTIDRIVAHVARFGVAASGDQLATLARLADAQGVAAVAGEVLVDAAAPEILRERAVARVATELRSVAPAAPLVAA